MTFSRALVTGDSKDTAITRGSLYLIWAYGSADGSGTTYPKHINTGAGLVNLLSAPGNSTPVNLTGMVLAGNSTTLRQLLATTPQVTSSTGHFKAWWSINATTQTFTFTMQGVTTGWISVGFSDTPFMTSSDAVVS